MMFTKGLRFMFLASLLFSLLNITVKSLPHIPVTEMIFFRSFISLSICVYFLKSEGVSFLGNNKPVLVARGVFGIIGLSLFMFTIHKMPLANAVVFHHLAPIFTTLLSMIFLKEKTKPLQWLFFAVSFVGIYLIKGFDERVSWELAAVGIFGALCSGAAYTCIRKLKTTEHPLVIMSYFPLLALPTMLVGSSEWVPLVTWHDWVGLVAVGLFTQAAQYFMTRSLQIESAAKVTPINYLGVIYALGLGYVFYGEVFAPKTLAAMGMVVFGVLLNIWYSHKYVAAVKP